MIGVLPRYKQAPLDYRYALDAAMTFLHDSKSPLIRCHIPELMPEIMNRIPILTDERETRHDGLLWIEPQLPDWENELQQLLVLLSDDVPLVVILSRPLAILLPERRAWRPTSALGVPGGGVRQLREAMKTYHLEVEGLYGFHTIQSMVLNFLASQATARGRPDLGDRLGFAGRLHYSTSGRSSALSTVSMLVAWK